MMYSQKVEWRRLVIIAAIVALGVVLLMGATPLNEGLARMFGFLLLSISVLCVWELAATRYEFARNELIIRSGGIQQRIRYETIEAVRVARGLWSYVVSPNNVRLLVGSRVSTGVISICPNDRDRFLDELSRAVPWLAVMDR